MGKIYDIAIIGGGAAGLYAAATLSSLIMNGKPMQVVLLEKMHRCGLKIGITGKGRCNITNTKPWEEFSSHIHPKNIFLKNAFYGMSNSSTLDFFNSIGLPTVIERGDRAFPQSMKALDVPAALERHILRGGIEIRKNTPVTGILHNDVENFFEIDVDESSRLFARKIIITTGGLSYPTTGSTGDGYKFAKTFGHKIVPCFPSLTALVPKNYREEYHGISLKNVSVQLVVNGDVVQEEFGDMDFTNGGIEGPIGFKVSRKGVHSLINGQKVVLRLDMKPAVSVSQLKERIAREVKQGSPGLKQLLPKLLPARLVQLFLAENRDLTPGNLPDRLKSWNFPISGYVGYERCVVTAGGVSLAEVSQKTMESKLVKGVYFAGEVLDLDGDTGGYNLQVAFSTGALAAVSAAKDFC